MDKEKRTEIGTLLENLDLLIQNKVSHIHLKHARFPKGDR